MHALHARYGPLVRTGPTSVDIADGAALHDIYVSKGGFLKAPFYANFDIDGHKSIFSEVVPEKRASRAKAVLPLFSTANLRGGRDTIYACVDKAVERLEAERKESAEKGTRVNVLNLARALATDAVSAYLFGREYGGIEEQGGQMSASGMVNAFVAVGRFFYLPGWMFQFLEWSSEKFFPDIVITESIAKVDDFVAKVVAIAEEKDRDKKNGSYPARLLDAGFSLSEARAQCKDLLFAGTDSTGMNLATICFELVRRPAVYGILRKEVMASKEQGDVEDLQSLPYLRGVIKEGLRISMANPSRLPRVVPPGGWHFKDTFFPAGSVVSCSTYELHFNEDVFEDAREFRPERWADGTTDEMNRDAIAFGLGPRQCIARNLASLELYCAVQRIVESDVLSGAKCCQDKIEIIEWFNSKVVHEKVELVWS